MVWLKLPQIGVAVTIMSGKGPTKYRISVKRVTRRATRLARRTSATSWISNTTSQSETRQSFWYSAPASALLPLDTEAVADAVTATAFASDRWFTVRPTITGAATTSTTPRCLDRGTMVRLS